jgi:hypothetical protein
LVKVAGKPAPLLSHGTKSKFGGAPGMLFNVREPPAEAAADWVEGLRKSAAGSASDDPEDDVGVAFKVRTAAAISASKFLKKVGARGYPGNLFASQYARTERGAFGKLSPCPIAKAAMLSSFFGGVTTRIDASEFVRPDGLRPAPGRDSPASIRDRIQRRHEANCTRQRRTSQCGQFAAGSGFGSRVFKVSSSG